MDRRVTAGETMKSCLKEVRKLDSVKKVSAELSVPEYEVKSYTGLIRKEKGFVPMWLMDQSHPLVLTAIEAYRSQFAGDPDVGTWTFSTNGVTTKGVYDIPSIGFGPGKEAHAHAPDEQVKIDDCVNAMAFYTAFAIKWSDYL